MLVKVFAQEGYAHLWNYENFKEFHNAKLMEHKSDTGLIEYIIYEICGEVFQDVLKDNGLTCEIINK